MCSVDLGPCLDDWYDLGRRQVCQRLVVVFRKGDHVAFARHRFSLQQEGRQTASFRSVVRLLLLHGCIVIHKNESALILRVDVSLRAAIPRAEVAFGIIFWEIGLRRWFLLAAKVV